MNEEEWRNKALEAVLTLSAYCSIEDCSDCVIKDICDCMDKSPCYWGEE